jgi:cysteine synthase
MMLELIGGTRVVPLRHLVPEGSAPVWLKLEYENPTGSMKDRMAFAMVEAAQRDGRLGAGGTVVEYTGGSTGVSLAFVCAVKRIPVTIVTSEAASAEKRAHMAALGARLHMVDAPGGVTTKALILELIETARRLSAAPGCYWTDQFNNRDQVAGYQGMADEIREQLPDGIAAFVQSVGTCGSLRGVSTRLRAFDPRLYVVAVEPEESPVLSGGAPGAHRIEGTGAGFVVPLWEPSLADDIARVSTAEAMAMARRLAREEGIFAGTSTGANVVAALRSAERLGPGRPVLTVAPDTGMKYLSTEQFGDSAR